MAGKFNKTRNMRRGTAYSPNCLCQSIWWRSMHRITFIRQWRKCLVSRTIVILERDYETSEPKLDSRNEVYFKEAKHISYLGSLWCKCCNMYLESSSRVSDPQIFVLIILYTLSLQKKTKFINSRNKIEWRWQFFVIPFHFFTILPVNSAIQKQCSQPILLT